MVEYRVVISDPKSGKAYQIEISGASANKFIGKSIGDMVDDETLGLPGYKLQIVGGTDNGGFAMRKDLPGGQRRKILISEGTGCHPKEKGQRGRKTVHGRDITADISQINVVVTKHGSKPIEDLIGKSKGEKDE
ncbi:MAG: 30S ribosomal protein S6e [Methanosarcinales archaeon Met12]|nr:MAG: 30S ribosomal protein S6e [Methanosarcinales archaeon Met12]